VLCGDRCWICCSSKPQLLHCFGALKDLLKERVLQVNIDVLPKDAFKKGQVEGREEETIPRGKHQVLEAPDLLNPSSGCPEPIQYWEQGISPCLRGHHSHTVCPGPAHGKEKRVSALCGSPTAGLG